MYSSTPITSTTSNFSSVTKSAMSPASISTVSNSAFLIRAANARSYVPSMPTTLAPRSAIARTFTPVPHPISRMRSPDPTLSGLKR